MQSANAKKPIDPTGVEFSVNQQNHAAYFEHCAKIRPLLNDIYCVVPVRPNDGTTCRLAEVQSVWYGEGTGWAHFNDHMGGYIEWTRANIAYNFVHNPPLRPDGKPCNFLLMIDNDMEPPLDLPWLLARHNLPCVGAACLSLHEEWGPQLCFSVKDEDGAWRFPCMRAGKIPAKGVVQVGHVGTGALLIRRDVLEAFSFEAGDIPFVVPDEHKMSGLRQGVITIGEDIMFCNQIRAKGIPIHVDLEAHVGHRKSLVLSWEEDMRDPFLDPKAWKLPAGVGKEIKST